eukprot:sb/3466631/
MAMGKHGVDEEARPEVTTKIHLDVGVPSLRTVHCALRELHTPWRLFCHRVTELQRFQLKAQGPGEREQAVRCCLFLIHLYNIVPGLSWILQLVQIYGRISNHQEAVCAQELHSLYQKLQGGRDFQFTFHLSQFPKKSARISRPNQTHGNLLDIKSSLKRMSCSNSSLTVHCALRELHTPWRLFCHRVTELQRFQLKAQGPGEREQAVRCCLFLIHLYNFVPGLSWILQLVQIYGRISNHQEAVCAQELHSLYQKLQGGRDFQFTFHLSQFPKKSARISRPNQTHGNLLDIKSSLKRMSCSNSSLLTGTTRRIGKFEIDLGTTNRQLQPGIQ